MGDGRTLAIALVGVLGLGAFAPACGGASKRTYKEVAAPVAKAFVGAGTVFASLGVAQVLVDGAAGTPLGQGMSDALTKALTDESVWNPVHGRAKVDDAAKGAGVDVAELGGTSQVTSVGTKLGVEALVVGTASKVGCDVSFKIELRAVTDGVVAGTETKTIALKDLPKGHVPAAWAGDPACPGT